MAEWSIRMSFHEHCISEEDYKKMEMLCSTANRYDLDLLRIESKINQGIARVLSDTKERGLTLLDILVKRESCYDQLLEILDTTLAQSHELDLDDATADQETLCRVWQRMLREQSEIYEEQRDIPVMAVNLAESSNYSFVAEECGSTFPFMLHIDPCDDIHRSVKQSAAAVKLDDIEDWWLGDDQD